MVYNVLGVSVARKHCLKHGRFQGATEEWREL
jgi:hypothetical protein